MHSIDPRHGTGAARRVAALLALAMVCSCGRASNELVPEGGGPAGDAAYRDGAGGDAVGGLAITTSGLPVAPLGAVYAATLAATGGAAPYHWSLASGALPAGLALAADGTIGGTPSAAGTSSFTVAVSDSATPAAMRTAPLSISVARTWYVRPDGGSRYSANATTGQCDGLADAAYPGSGTNQHCAFGDFRYLYDDRSYANSAWVIAGGDTVIVRGGPWRIGADMASAPAGSFCGGIGPYCGAPQVPAGTAAQHTRFLGENYASCTTKTQIFGSRGVGAVFNLSGAAFVDLECLELTDHAQCSQSGEPREPSDCVYGTDEYASNGIVTDVGTHDVLLQDLDIHGFTSRAVIGPIGGEIDVRHVRMGFNGQAGWDFDDGRGTASVHGRVVADDLVIEWNGCTEEYPVTHRVPALYCYDQDSGGYGDGLGTPNTPLDFSCDHCVARYNTQDGMDLGHVSQSAITFTNSSMYGNMGGTYKIGGNYQMTLVNNVSIGNCHRMAEPVDDAPATFNMYLSLWCRANDQLSANFAGGASAADSVLTYEFNTIVGYEDTILDVSCDGPGDCTNANYTFRNNVVMGFGVPDYNSARVPGVFYNVLPTTEDHNLFFSVRDFTCPTGHAGDLCSDPAFVSEPPAMLPNEAALDNFDFALTPGSPARGAGVAVTGVSTDGTGAPRATPPSLGARE